jgi:hypothetical protein
VTRKSLTRGHVALDLVFLCKVLVKTNVYSDMNILNIKM